MVTCTTTDAIARTASCSFAVTVTPPPPRLKYTKFMAFGDSITAGEVPDPTDSSLVRLRSVQPDKAYPAQLAKLLAARYTGQTITVFNEGLQGAHAIDDAAGGGHSFAAALAKDQPDVVLLLEGVNDLSSYAKINQTIQSGLRSMWFQARQSGAQVIVSTLTPMIRGGSRAGAIDLLPPFNDQLTAVAALDQVPVIDLYNLMLPQVDTLISSLDGLHPNELGYAFMGQQFFNVIKSMWELPPGTPTTTTLRPPRLVGPQPSSGASPARKGSSGGRGAGGQD